MKTRFIFLLVFASTFSFSQSVNDYKAVIIPVKYDFLKKENEFRLNTLTKFNLKKAGFEAFYNNESIPKTLSDRCSFLYADVKDESALLTTKLFITFKDCNGALIFQSEIGKSREKEYQLSYSEALNDAFESVYALHYKYKEIEGDLPRDEMRYVADKAVQVPNDNNSTKPSSISKDSNLFYAQVTPYGFQLVDSEPKVVFKIFRTSNATCFIAIKGIVQGVFIANENQWFFEYYQNDTLISEKVEVKF